VRLRQRAGLPRPHGGDVRRVVHLVELCLTQWVGAEELDLAYRLAAQGLDDPLRLARRLKGVTRADVVRAEEELHDGRF
jgi:hypothetical protein